MFRIKMHLQAQIAHNTHAYKTSVRFTYSNIRKKILIITKMQTKASFKHIEHSLHFKKDVPNVEFLHDQFPFHSHR
jgi:hypothetical protein